MGCSVIAAVWSSCLFTVGLAAIGEDCWQRSHGRTCGPLTSVAVVSSFGPSRLVVSAISGSTPVPLSHYLRSYHSLFLWAWSYGLCSAHAWLYFFYYCSSANDGYFQACFVSASFADLASFLSRCGCHPKHWISFPACWCYAASYRGRHRHTSTGAAWRLATAQKPDQKAVACFQMSAIHNYCLHHHL